MKLFNVMFVAVLMTVTSSLCYYVVNTEAHVAQWNRRISDLEYQRSQQEQVQKSQEYSRDLFKAVQTLAEENGILCERDKSTMQYVAAIEEENTKLAGSLNEAVRRMEEMIKENNQLHEELSNSIYKIECLEKALSLIPEDPKDKPFDTFDALNSDLIPSL